MKRFLSLLLAVMLLAACVPAWAAYDAVETALNDLEILLAFMEQKIAADLYGSNAVLELADNPDAEHLLEAQAAMAVADNTMRALEMPEAGSALEDLLDPYDGDLLAIPMTMESEGQEMPKIRTILSALVKNDMFGEVCSADGLRTMVDTAQIRSDRARLDAAFYGSMANYFLLLTGHEELWNVWTEKYPTIFTNAPAWRNDLLEIETATNDILDRQEQLIEQEQEVSAGKALVVLDWQMAARSGRLQGLAGECWPKEGDVPLFPLPDFMMEEAGWTVTPYRLDASGQVVPVMVGDELSEGALLFTARIPGATPEKTGLYLSWLESVGHTVERTDDAGTVVVDAAVAPIQIGTEDGVLVLTVVEKPVLLFPSWKTN